MHEITHAQVPVEGAVLHVAHCGPSDGPPVVLCHGFPELWYSWRHQLPFLGDLGYHAIAPDLRGYGSSSRPPEVAAYGTDRIAADLCGVLEHFDLDRSVFVGHDWGAIAVWEMGLLHPDRVSAIYNLSVPFAAPGPTPPTEVMEAVFADRFFYILYFQTPGVAEDELEHDPRTFLRAFFYGVGGEGMREGGRGLLPREGTRLLDTFTAPPSTLPGWLTEDDLDVYATAFDESGFAGPLNYYRNLDANWTRNKDIPPAVLTMPTGFCTGSLDPVKAMFRNADDRMASQLPDFRGTTDIEGAGHWVQQERPGEVNEALGRFLSLVH
jgi:pimeloyl-ACP methyl ester carboxylesterase